MNSEKATEKQMNYIKYLIHQCEKLGKKPLVRSWLPSNRRSDSFSLTKKQAQTIIPLLKNELSWLESLTNNTRTRPDNERRLQEEKTLRSIYEFVIKTPYGSEMWATSVNRFVKWATKRFPGNSRFFGDLIKRHSFEVEFEGYTIKR